MRPDFRPRTGWRWWLHFGANETRLMYPKVKLELNGVFPLLYKTLENLMVELGQLLVPVFKDIQTMLEGVTASLFGEQERSNI